ncbi:MAG: MBL fold metallo-hydrolase [Cellvibrionaceae bacterium]|nr:MBL fold metallo-hydrolase [Cellvibrionaceae bacterium]
MPIRQHYHYQHADGTNLSGVKVGRLKGGINTNFIVYRIGSVLIDAGPSNQWRHVKAFLQQGEPIEQLWLTHHHEDHSGNASRIARLYKLRPLAPALAQQKLARGFRIPALQQMTWGKPRRVVTETLPERLQLDDGSEVIAIHTPGHAADLTCFYLPQQRWFFSGDLYLARRLKYMRADENLMQLMLSLKQVLALDIDVVFCPHRGIDEQGKAGMLDKLDFLIQLCRDCQRLAAEGEHTAAIGEQLLGPPEMMDKITRGNFSKLNLVREALLVDLAQFN